MKAFHFSLERVLSWRKMQLAAEQARLEHMQAALLSVEQAIEHVLQRRVDAQAKVAHSQDIPGADLASLESLRLWSLRESEKLKTQASALSKAIEQQNLVVTEAHRRVRLVERLKERRHATWKVEASKEIEQLAGEFAVDQWRRHNE